ncbi:molecular chaperone DnaJ [candidate division KD3-62 bacterium DG_56]|uniref:Chaperone protein DnaJ n=1 Tax=candidate division KD3-62 bacterium DG_56 TaxID=1704032 RepID=A0A0S7XJZ5_9BACT|nr:MAG: molecular chaperone DnaJ [candidate division KD3-62 bacterium DG_56]
MASKRDYYEVLEVDPSASQDEIKRAYRRLARRYHPDCNAGDPDCEARFKEVGEAYEVLSDPQKRAQYDRFGQVGVGVTGGAGYDPWLGFGDLFETMFGMGGPRTRQRAETRGSDLRYDLELSLEEAALGCQRTVRISRMMRCDTCRGTGSKGASRPAVCPTCGGTGQVSHTRTVGLGMQFRSVGPCERCGGEGRLVTDPCPRCHGRGRERRTEDLKVRIPAGVDSGARVRLAGEGDAGMRGGTSGDLYVNIHLRPHQVFERQNTEIICEVPVSFVTATLGGKVKVPTLDGHHELAIPPGTQHGATFRIRGKGMPDLHSAHRGDQHVVVRIVVPERLNSKQRELLKEFARHGGEDLDQERGFFDRVKDALGGEP